MSTSTSEDQEVVSRDEVRPEAKLKASNMKNANWNERDQEKKANDFGVLSNSAAALEQMLAREIRRSEESLHTRIGWLYNWEGDGQAM